MCDITVMVAEKEIGCLQVICEELKNQGINRLLCVDNKHDTLAYLSDDDQIDILIVGDSTGGLDLIETVRLMRPSTQCIYCEQTEDILGGLIAKSRGAHDYVRKGKLREQLGVVLPYLIHKTELYHAIQ